MLAPSKKLGDNKHKQINTIDRFLNMVLKNIYLVGKRIRKVECLIKYSEIDQSVYLMGSSELQKFW
jgi:hypothetical protein